MYGSWSFNLVREVSKAMQFPAQRLTSVLVFESVDTLLHDPFHSWNAKSFFVTSLLQGYFLLARNSLATDASEARDRNIKTLRIPFLKESFYPCKIRRIFPYSNYNFFLI